MPSTNADNFWRGRAVLVTGCSGFLGTWATKLLLTAGAKVNGIIHRDVRESSYFAQLGLHQKVELHQGSTLDLSFVSEVMRTKFDAVIHAAGQAFMPLARTQPHETFEANVRGTWNVLEAIRSNGCKTPTVICSSDCVYGEPDGNVCTEESPLRGAGPYEVSKTCAEQVSQTYSRTFAIPVGIARFSNLYGEGDCEMSRIVPGTIRSSIQGESPVIRSNGLAIRDYLYVEDAARGLLSLAAALISGNVKHDCFNFSSERPVNVLDLVKLILQSANRADLSPQVMDQTTRTISRKEVSSARARTTLGWLPTTSLERGLANTFNWHRDCSPVSVKEI